MIRSLFEDLYQSQLNLILVHLESHKPVPIELLEAVKILACLIRLPEEMIEKLENTLDRLVVESDKH